MALGTFIAGRYAGTWNSVDVGITRDGYDLSMMAHQELVNKSDAYGDSLIDTVTRGGDVSISFESKEYKAGSTAPFWPFAGGSLGRMYNGANPIGVLGSAVAQAFVLTATANTPAAAAPATLTASKALRAPGDARLRFDSSLRHVPIRLICFPSESGGVGTWFTTT